MAEEQTIEISGAPVITSLNGIFYLSNPDQTGYNRIWRNKGPSAIYYQQPDQNNINIQAGWKLADIITGTVYFSETTPSAADPWNVKSSSGWSSTNYIDHCDKLELTPAPNISRTTTVAAPDDEDIIFEDCYDLTPDNTFHATNAYYYKVGNKYYRVRQIVAGNKIDPDTFYEMENGVASNDFTTDSFFNSDKTYCTKLDDNVIPSVWIESEIPTNTYYNIIGKETTVSESEVDNLTGSITKRSVHTVKDVKKIEIDVHKRYCAPKVEVGQVYRFAFIKDFRYLGYLPPSKLDFELEGRYDEEVKGENDSDITRGIFRVENITNYYNLVISGIDIYQNLYLPLNLSHDLYEADRKKWMNDDIWYKLVNPALTTQVYYVPLGIIDGIPDGNVTEYERYHLVIDIGIFKDPEFLAEMVTDINMLMRAKFGVPTTAQLASYDKLYIPDEYYEWLEKVRKTYIDNFMETNGSQYYETLFYDKYNHLHKENLALAKKVHTYESVLNEVNNNG